MALERKYQPTLIKRIKEQFPGCIILKNDPNYIQGFPDLTVLYKNKWAVLQTKRQSSATHRPNQDYYIDVLNGMSYASFVCPENEKEVLDGLQRSFQT